MSSNSRLRDDTSPSPNLTADIPSRRVLEEANRLAIKPDLSQNAIHGAISGHKKQYVVQTIVKFKSSSVVWSQIYSFEMYTFSSCARLREIALELRIFARVVAQEFFAKNAEIVRGNRKTQFTCMISPKNRVQMSKITFWYSSNQVSGWVLIDTPIKQQKKLFQMDWFSESTLFSFDHTAN